MMACAICLAFLTGCLGRTEPPNPWDLVETDFLANPCPRSELPVMAPGGWGSCDKITRASAERLGAHKRTVEEKRQ